MKWAFRKAAIINLCLLLFLSNICTAQNIYNLSSYHLKGPVKRVEQTFYRESNKKNNTGAHPIQWFFVTYDFNIDGNLTMAQTGRVGKIYITRTFKYDSEGYLAEETSPLPDGSDKVVYQTDVNGKVLEFGECLPDGKIKPISRYKYDEEGNCTETWDILPNGNWYLSRKSTFDKKGHRTANYRLKSDGTSYINDSWEYDQNGNNTVRYSYNTSGKLFYRYTYKYDEKGNVIEWCDYMPDGKLSRKDIYTYAFDSNGNWIEKISWDPPLGSAAPISAGGEKRKIEYYKTDIHERATNRDQGTTKTIME